MFSADYILYLFSGLEIHALNDAKDLMQQLKQKGLTKVTMGTGRQGDKDKKIKKSSVDHSSAMKSKTLTHSTLQARGRDGLVD